MGELVLRYEVLTPPGDHGQAPILFTPEEGSSSAKKLRVLTGTRDFGGGSAEAPRDPRPRPGGPAN